jgi:hypothetical protein
MLVIYWNFHASAYSVQGCPSHWVFQEVHNESESYSENFCTHETTMEHKGHELLNASIERVDSHPQMQTQIFHFK